MKHDMTIIRFSNGLAFPTGMLKAMLPDMETTLFFAQLYRLNAQDLGVLVHSLFRSPVIDALTAEGGLHSDILQDYLVEVVPDVVRHGDIIFGEVKPKGEILPELWASAQVEIAASIQAVADKLKDVVTALPGKQGEMVFKTMQVMNSRRPTIGDHRAHVHHAPQAPNLVVLDVSGSMTEGSVQAIVEDVVALSWAADAHLAIVSNSTTHWVPGEFSVEAVLRAAEYGGTHYETLAPLFESQQWGTVITIADYDSSASAKSAIRECANSGGTIDTVLDISLVSRPTYLAEVLGQLAGEVRPLIIAADDYSLR